MPIIDQEEAHDACEEEEHNENNVQNVEGVGRVQEEIGHLVDLLNGHRDEVGKEDAMPKVDWAA